MSATMEREDTHVEVHWRGRAVQIEYRWIEPRSVRAEVSKPRAPFDTSGRTVLGRPETAPLIVFLHEGLGSLSLWKEFPQQLCEAAGCRGLVYSRPGYGRSTPRAAEEAWGVDFLHRQAHEVLPALFEALDIDTESKPPWLFGHSDGASIALLYAAAHPTRVSGLVVLAPHIMVEELAVSSIAKARDAYLESDMRERLAKHHADPDSAFWGWNDIWLHPPFKEWSIEQEIQSIACPLLAVQGLDDEYGTLEQIRGIARRLPQTHLLELVECRHSAHRDQPERVIAATTAFIAQHHNGDIR